MVCMMDTTFRTHSVPASRRLPSWKNHGLLHGVGLITTFPFEQIMKAFLFLFLKLDLIASWVFLCCVCMLRAGCCRERPAVPMSLLTMQMTASCMHSTHRPRAHKTYPLGELEEKKLKSTPSDLRTAGQPTKSSRIPYTAGPSQPTRQKIRSKPIGKKRLGGN
ncbi:hypothetical protein HDK90DRAFT_295944 [Phyllosticta capitalensis]|uniref:Uncharacterized protein n=1 Tax=Phyllosticta capitalensis TaxID=121624 RepID=A0ABR1YKC4_9PEZI